MKLAQRELMAREWGEEPVLLLDDVLSELDPGRQDFVLNKIVSGRYSSPAASRDGSPNWEKQFR